MGHEWPKPHGGAARGPTAPATEEGDSATSPSPPFDYLTLSDLKREGGSPLHPETSPYTAAIAKPISGTRNSVLALRRDGELEEIIAIIITDASPSTIHVSPIHV